MTASDYIDGLRTKVGKALLLVPSVVTIAVDDASRVLLVKHSERPGWIAPGGSVEPHEAPADAAVRETWEETGILTRPARVVGVFGGPEFSFVYPSGDHVAYVVTVFHSDVVGGSTAPDGSEVIDARFFPLSEMPAAVDPWVREVVALAASGSPTWFAPATWVPS